MYQPGQEALGGPVPQLVPGEAAGNLAGEEGGLFSQRYSIETYFCEMVFLSYRRNASPCGTFLLLRRHHERQPRPLRQLCHGVKTPHHFAI